MDFRGKQSVVNILIFLQCKAENVLKMILNLHGIIEYYKAKLREYRVNCVNNALDFVPPDDFDDVSSVLRLAHLTGFLILNCGYVTL